MSKVAIICYACSPYQGSEAGVGWGIISSLANDMNIIAFVETEKFKDEIDKYIEEFPNSSVANNVEFIFVKKTRGRLLRKIWPPSYYWFYRRWQRKVYKLLDDKVKRNEISLIHAVTMIGFREPGYAWRLNVPFVIGPIGGLGYVHFKDFKYFDAYGKLYYFFFNVFNFLHTNFSWRVFQAWKKANEGGVGLIAADHINAHYIDKLTGSQPIVFPEVGPPNHTNFKERSVPQSEVLRLIWVGNIENRKGLIILLKALKCLKRPYELEVFGSGPLIKKMARFAKKHSIKVIFHGQVSRDKILEGMSQADLFVLTSLRDASATVTIEANYLGVPVVCFNRGGFAKWLSPDSNYILKSDNDLVDALNNFLENFEINLNRNSVSISINDLFRWDIKNKIIRDIYVRKTLK